MNHRKTLHNDILICSQTPAVKKWKDIRYRRYDSNLFPEILTNIKKEDDPVQLWKSFSSTLRLDKDKVKDMRACEFCQEHGDADPNGSGRLVYDFFIINFLQNKS